MAGCGPASMLGIAPLSILAAIVRTVITEIVRPMVGAVAFTPRIPLIQNRSQNSSTRRFINTRQIHYCGRDAHAAR